MKQCEENAEWDMDRKGAQPRVAIEAITLCQPEHKGSQSCPGVPVTERPWNCSGPWQLLSKHVQVDEVRLNAEEQPAQRPEAECDTPSQPARLNKIARSGWIHFSFEWRDGGIVHREKGTGLFARAQQHANAVSLGITRDDID